MTESGRWRRQDLFAAAAMALVIGLVGLLRSHLEDPNQAGVLPTSSMLSGPGGVRALYLAAEDVDIPVRRWMRPLPESTGEVGVLAIIAPSEPLLPSEAAGLRDWVARGGRLLYVASPGGQASDAFLEVLGLTQDRGGDFEAAMEPALRGTARKVGNSDAGAENAEAQSLLEDTPDTVIGFPQELSSSGGANESPTVLLSGDGRKIAAAFVHLGEGRIVLFSHPIALTNRFLRESGIAPLVLRSLALLSCGNAVWFDEFHHGYDDRVSLEQTIWRFLTGTPSGWAILELGLIATLALAFAGTRFGSPLPAPLPKPRSSLEHVEALASAYGKARAVRRSTGLLLEGLRVAMGARTVADLVPRLEILAEANPDTLTHAREITARIRAPTAPPDLVRLCHTVDRVLAVTRTRAPRSSRDLETGAPSATSPDSPEVDS